MKSFLGLKVSNLTIQELLIHFTIVVSVPFNRSTKKFFLHITYVTYYVK